MVMCFLSSDSLAYISIIFYLALLIFFSKSILIRLETLIAVIFFFSGFLAHPKTVCLNIELFSS